MKTPIPQHPWVEAINTWKASDDFLASANPITLNAPALMRQYLENRLESAFQKGLAAGEEIAVKAVQARMCHLVDEALDN